MHPEPDGGPAFPSSEIEEVFVEEFGRWDKRLAPPTGGMSLRDYFAAKAMVALMSSDASVRSMDAAAVKQNVGLSTCLVETAYRYADAMLTERAK